MVGRGVGLRGTRAKVETSRVITGNNGKDGLRETGEATVGLGWDLGAARSGGDPAMGPRARPRCGVSGETGVYSLVGGVESAGEGRASKKLGNLVSWHHTLEQVTWL